MSEPKEEEKGKNGSADEQEPEQEECCEGLDQCLMAATRRLGASTLLGFVGSAAVRRRWPLVLGMGIGVGQSIADCREAICEKKETEEEDKEKEKKEGEATEEKKDKK